MSRTTTTPARRRGVDTPVATTINTEESQNNMEQQTEAPPSPAPSSAPPAPSQKGLDILQLKGKTIALQAYGPHVDYLQHCTGVYEKVR